MRRWVLGLAILAACDGSDEGVPIDAPATDGPDIDAPDVDAPPIDAPDIDGPDIDAPIDAPAGAFIVDTVGLGAGRVTVGGAVAPFCGLGPCNYPAGSYALRFNPIGDSVFTGVTGCTLDGPDTCMASGGTTITATFQPITVPAQQATWIRTARIPSSVVDLALTSDGVVVAGAAESGGLWVARYAADATPGPSFIDPAASVTSAVAVLPDGDAIVLTPSQFRRYTPTGTFVGSTTPGGTLGTNALAVGPNGTIYIAGVAAGDTYVAAFNSGGIEQWRTTVPGVDAIDGLAVRGDLVAAVGRANNSGWVGTFDLQGTPGWTRAIRGPQLQQDVRLSDVGIDSDGDVVFGGLDIFAAPARYTLGAVNGTAADPLWLVQHATRSNGDLWVRADDTVLLLLGYASAGNMDPARVIAHTEAGAATDVGAVANVYLPGGLAVTAAGDVFLAGQGFFNFPAVERRP